MADLLSQDEIDALLQGVDDGAIGADAPPPAPGEARAWDFARPQRGARDRMPGLETIHERFVRGLKAALPALVRRPVDVVARSTRVLPCDEYMASLPQPASLHVAQAAPLAGECLVAIEPRLLFAVVDGFFGGAGRNAAHAEGRALTPTESRIAQLLQHQVHRDLADAWAPLQALAFGVVRHESHAGRCGFGEGTEPVVLSRFSLAIDGGGGGELHVAFPLRALAPVRGLLDVATPPRPRAVDADADATWTRRMRAGVHDAALEARVSIARRGISLRALSRLKVGDVIPIELARRVHLEVGPAALFEGEFGIHQGQNAFKVAAPLPRATAGGADDMQGAIP